MCGHDEHVFQLTGSLAYLAVQPQDKRLRLTRADCITCTVALHCRQQQQRQHQYFSQATELQGHLLEEPTYYQRH